jgi:exodeoxyribonuclease VII large subunit
MCSSSSAPDPGHDVIAPAVAKTLRTARDVSSVAALVGEIGSALAGRFVVCSVQGEVSGFSRADSGHCCFALKNADGQPAMIRRAMFRPAQALLGFAPADRQLVEVRGRPEV